MLELYYAPIGPPSRSVRLAAEYIGLPLKLTEVDVLKGEQHSPEFEMINPAKKVPVLVDGDLKLSESRAIMIYLVEKYGKGSKILPMDPCGRGMVNMALHFDINKINLNMVKYYFPVLFKMKTEYNPMIYESLKDSYAALDQMLEQNEFVAGPHLTIADLSLITSVTTAQVLGFDMSEYKNVLRWIDKVKSVAPGFKDIDDVGVEHFRQLVEASNDEN